MEQRKFANKICSKSNKKFLNDDYWKEYGSTCTFEIL